MNVRDFPDKHTVCCPGLEQIPDICKWFSDAMDRSTISVYCPPCSCGYHMCVPTYLIGIGIHMSVSFFDIHHVFKI